MNKYLALAFCIICSIVPFIAIGINYFALYQLLPIVVFYLFQRSVFKHVTSTQIKVCYVLAILTLLIFPIAAQLAWYFDVNKLASKSSTSGLLFVFLPIYATLPGLIPCLIASHIKSKGAEHH